MTQDAAEPKAKEKESETNIKETIESILIAFILAFIFRGFVVEAFVIPTGSMAPTLMGAHMRFRCQDCGYEWTVNYPTNSDSDDVTIPSRAYLMTSDGRIVIDDSKRPVNKTFHVLCPNCGFQVPRSNPIDPDDCATSPPVHYGDRILVLKYLYLFQKPRRWDVVVFKAPEAPYKYDYQQNYIKRLIGRPGETIMLLDGDVYVAPNLPGKDPTPDDFVVQTKPRNVQDSLWRIVYDNDYYPQNKAFDRGNTQQKWVQPWTAQRGQSGWTLDGREFTFDNPTGAADIFFNASANPAKHSLTDWLAYDITVRQSVQRRDDFNNPGYEPDDNVSDVRLSFFYQRTAGDGPIRASVSKLDRTFIAEIAPGKATLLQRLPNAAPQVLASVPLEVDTTKPTRIDLINCDYQVTLRVNDRQVIQTTPQQFHPNVRYLLKAFDNNDEMPKPAIHISAANQKCTISHLSLWRDIYYMNRVPQFNSGGRLTWAVPDQFPDNLMRLKADPPEYFCCGDNSPISGDGRYWQTDINLPHEDLIVESGRVPGRFLLGKAFFVYWPAGFRPVEQAPAIVPNFGDMRFIR